MDNRNLQDAALNKSVALPAAGSTATTAVIDLNADLNGPIEAVISHEALPALVEAKTVTLKIEHSDSATTGFADAATAALVTTGGTGNGADAAELRVALPAGTKRYVRLSAAVLADGGNNTAKSAKISLRF